MQAAYRGPAVVRSPARRTTGSSRRARRIARERSTRRRGPPGAGRRGRRRDLHRVDLTAGRSAHLPLVPGRDLPPVRDDPGDDPTSEATLRPASARTAPKVDPADWSRETSQRPMRQTHGKRYDNGGLQATEIGRDGKMNGDQRGVREPRTASETIFRRSACRRPGTCRPGGPTGSLDPSRAALGQYADRPARLVEQRAPLPPIGNLQCPSVPPPAARWPHRPLIDRGSKLYPGGRFCTLDPMRKSLLIGRDEEMTLALLRTVFGARPPGPRGPKPGRKPPAHRSSTPST